MTQFGHRIEPITSTTLGGCATVYATEAGLARIYPDLIKNKNYKLLQNYEKMQLYFLVIIMIDPINAMKLKKPVAQIEFSCHGFPFLPYLNVAPYIQ